MKIKMPVERAELFRRTGYLRKLENGEYEVTLKGWYAFHPGWLEYLRADAAVGRLLIPEPPRSTN